MGGEHADLADRHVVLGLDEDGAEPFEPAHDVVVVDDVVAHVDGRPVLVEQALDDLDRPVDAGAERARRGKQHALAHLDGLPEASQGPASARVGAARTSARPQRRRAGVRASESPSGRDRRLEPGERPRGRVAHARTHAGKPAAAREHARLQVGRDGAGGEQRPRARRRRRRSGRPRGSSPSRRRRTPSGAPSHRARRTSSTTRVASSTVPIGRPSSPPAIPNETTPSGTPLAPPIRRGQPRPGPAGHASLGRGGAGEGQPVSVQAMLLALCFTLFVAANAAAGSNPNGCRSARTAGRYPGRTLPTPSRPSAPRTWGRCRP